MPSNMKGRSFLRLMDCTPEEVNMLIDMAIDLKKMKRIGVYGKKLEGKNVALIFEKASADALLL